MERGLFFKRNFINSWSNNTRHVGKICSKQQFLPFCNLRDRAGHAPARLSIGMVVFMVGKFYKYQPSWWALFHQKPSRSLLYYIMGRLKTIWASNSPKFKSDWLAPEKIEIQPCLGNYRLYTLVMIAPCICKIYKSSTWILVTQMERIFYEDGS